MATNPTIQFKRKITAGIPGSLSLAEPAVNTADNQLFIGVNAAAVKWVGAEIENSATNGSTWSSDLKLATKKAIGDYFLPLGGGLLTGDITLGSGSDLRFRETGGGTDYVAFQAPASIAASVTWTLPGVDGGSGEVLTTNGSGTLSWASAGSATTVTTNTDNTNTTRYLVFGATATAGATLYVDDTTTPLSYNPSTAALTVGGNVSATTVNKVTLTAPATGSTLTVADGKTLTASNTLTFTGTDASSVAFGAGGTVVYTSGLGTGVATFLATPSSANLASALTDETGSGSAVFATSPTLTTPSLGVATALTINKVTLTAPATGSTLTVADGKTLTASNTLTFTGTDASSVAFGAGGTVVYTSGLGTNVATFLATPSSANLISAITDETGSGLLVFGTSPSLTTPSLSSETYSTSATVTAGTNAIGQGAITSDYNIITTTANNPSGVTLPKGVAGRRIIVVNKGTNAINVYPSSSGGTDLIDALSIGASIQIPVSGLMEFNASTTTQWYSSGNSTFTAPVLGTPVSGTLTNCTGLPVSSGISGLGSGVATFLATPSSANLASALTDETGSGSAVFATSPTLVTPTIGAATATTINNVTITAPATGSTLTVADGKTLTASNTLTFTGTDASSVAFGAGGTVVYTSGLGTGVATFLATPSSANLISAITDETGTGALVFANSPTLITPALGTPSALIGTNISGTGASFTAGTVTTNANLTGHITSTGNATVLGSFTSSQLSGALTDETGSGSAVFATSPTLVTPTIGAATATSVNKVTITAPATGSTLTVAEGKTLTASNTLTFTGTDASSVAFGAGGTVVYTSGLGTGVATFLATPSSANLISAITDETGTGSLVFSASPTFTGTLNCAALTSTGNVTVGGDLIVNGTTTTINSSVTTLDDPIITLGGDTNPASDDNKDRGVEFRWHDGATHKRGFFGFDDSTGYMTFIPDATNTSEVFSGTAGDIVATNFRGALIGNADTVTTNANLTGHITSTGNATVLGSFTSSQLSGALTDETGSGVAVFATSPTLVTPTIGAATATTINKVTITAPATGSTLTVADGKTLTASNTLTFTGTDASSVAFGAGGTVVYTSGLGTGVATFLATPSSANLASAITDETGTGALVFGTSPSLTTPAIGAGGLTIAGSTSGTTSFLATAVASGIITFPAVTGTVITTGNLTSIGDAAADGSTKGLATFNSTQFDAASGVITLDTIDGGTYA